jgi:hypothetical protein
MSKSKIPPEARAYFVKMGRIGGLLGGKARAESLSPEKRREIARKAVTARWARKKTGKSV